MNCYAKLKNRHLPALMAYKKQWPAIGANLIEILKSKDYFSQIPYYEAKKLCDITHTPLDKFVTLFGNKCCETCNGEGVFKITDCCGADIVSNGDSDTSDLGICPECGDHCEYLVNCEECKGEGVL